MGLIDDIYQFERHDKIIIVAIFLLMLGTWFSIKDPAFMTKEEIMSFLRMGAINGAMLLLIADIVIHLVRMEKKLMTGEKKLEKEEKVLEEKEKKLEGKETELEKQEKKLERKITARKK